MKATLTNLIDNDTSYNKSVTRYLSKTHPDLWFVIMSITDFLPDDAMPKQRVWHILNDIYTRPTCPVTGLYVKWFENRYLNYIDQSAKMLKMNWDGRLVNSHTPESNAKKVASAKAGFASGRLTKKVWTEEESKARHAKIEQAVLEKHGVKSVLSLPEVREKAYQTGVANGTITPREDREPREIYYNAVKRLTAISWNTHFNDINPKWLDRSEYNLDHIFSIFEGFKQGIPPYIIAHWTNLRMLEPKLNSSKRDRCDKTKEQLFEDCFTVADW